MAPTSRAHLQPVTPRPAPSRSFGAATIIVMAATLASTIFGFGREVVNAAYYGTQWEMDTFLAAATVPTILFGIFNGALVSALVPVFSDYLANGREEEAWRLASTVINVIAIVLTIGVFIGWVLAPYYVPLIAHGFPGPQMHVAIRMTRWLIPTILFTSLAGVAAALLNSYHRFGAAALQGVAINAVTIAIVVWQNHRMGIYALVLGTALGLVAQLLIQLPGLIAMGRYRFVMDIHHPGLQRIWWLLGPIVVGSAAGQVAMFFDRFFASTLSPGYMAGMNYAIKLVGFPQQIFAAAIATVIFPLLASQFASRNRTGVRKTAVLGLRVVNFITIPAVCGLIVLRRPIVETLFQRGAFQSTATDLCSTLLPYCAIGLVALAANIVLTRCCFACNEARWTVGISVATVVLNVLLSLWWLQPLGARGLLLANSVSQSAQAVALFALVWHLLHGFDWKLLLRSAFGTVVSATAMVTALLWIESWGMTPGAAFASQLSYLLGQLAIGALVYVAVARLIGMDELNMAIDFIVEKYRSQLISPPDNRNVPIA
jgi:putative peptidoglycan lipid II flippase